MISRLLLTGAACVALAACGGGGSGPPPSSGPSPTPTPTPTPSPTPTSTGSTARTLGISTGPSFWRFFSDSNFDEDTDFLAGGYGNRMGEYFPDFANRDGLPGTTSGQRQGDQSDRAKRAVYIDAHTGLRNVLRGAEDMTIVSPLSSLLTNGPDQDTLKVQLGISEGPFRLLTIDPDLRTFDPVEESQGSDADRAADAQRLLAANARALALITLQISASNRDILADDLDDLTQALDASPILFLFDNNTAMTNVIAALPRYSGLDRNVQNAIAHLINAYAATVPLRIENEAQAAQFQMAVIGFLQPNIVRLERTNSSEIADEVLALTTEDIRDATARFAESLPVTSDGLFFPAPDYYEVAAGGTLELVDVTPSNQSNNHPIENDFSAEDAGFSRILRPTITQVSVPSSNTAEVSASLGAENLVTITPEPGFIGLSYVDYTVIDGNGETQTARIFVRVTP